MEKKELIDLDGYMKILNFLTYLQSIDVLSETQRIDYSNYIQEYLKGRKNNLDILNQCLIVLMIANLQLYFLVLEITFN